MKDKRRSGSFNKRRLLGTEFYLFIFLAAIFALLRLGAADFYSLNNLMSTLNYFSYLLIGAVGMNLIIITGNIDVSAGALISVIAISVAFLGKLGLPWPVFMPLGMLVGAGLSLLNGLFITRLRIPSIVATLASTQLFAGILPLLVEGSIYDLPASFTWLAFKAKLGGVVPASALFALLVAASAMLYTRYARFAKRLYAIGNNAHAARLSGIKVDADVVRAYVIAGCLYGISATLIATAGQRVTTTMGSGFDFTMIAAVVLGGTSIAGGSGKILGTVFGAMILSVISPAMNYLGLSSDWSDAVIGGIILLAVIVGAAGALGRKRSLSETGVTEG